MGKAQSKRSVDITTETKEGVAPAEGESGKVGKIEDVDQVKPELNGETNKDADSVVSTLYSFYFLLVFVIKVCSHNYQPHLFMYVGFEKKMNAK